MANKLIDLEITEFSLVDSPANPLAKVHFFKRANEEEKENTLVAKVLKGVKELFDKSMFSENYERRTKWTALDDIVGTLRSTLEELMFNDEFDKATKLNKLTESLMDLQNKTVNVFNEKLAKSNTSKEEEEMDMTKLTETFESAIAKAVEPLTVKIEELETKLAKAEEKDPEVEKAETEVEEKEVEKAETKVEEKEVDYAEVIGNAISKALEPLTNQVTELADKVAKVEEGTQIESNVQKTQEEVSKKDFWSGVLPI